MLLQFMEFTIAVPVTPEYIVVAAVEPRFVAKLLYVSAMIKIPLAVVVDRMDFALASSVPRRHMPLRLSQTNTIRLQGMYKCP